MPTEFRAAPELGEGVAEAVVSTYNVAYPIGRKRMERISPGAFDESIRDRTFPIFYQHQWDAGPIGHQTFVSNERGLVATQRYYIEDDPRARSVFRALEAGALREHSIGFTAGGADVAEERADDGVVTEAVSRGALCESSVVVRGANPQTETTSVRSETEEAEDEAAAAAEAANNAAVEAWHDELLSRLSDSRVRALLRESFV